MGELDKHAGDLARAAHEAVCRKLRYRSADVADPRSVAKVLDAGETDGQAVAVYLALPARVFTPAVTARGVIGLAGGSRIALGLHIEQVDLLWEEDLALEGRAGFYDRTGALKDVIQIHPLQVLCLVAMEPPTSVDERDLRDRKIDVLRAVRP